MRITNYNKTAANALATGIGFLTVWSLNKYAHADIDAAAALAFQGILQTLLTMFVPNTVGSGQVADTSDRVDAGVGA